MVLYSQQARKLAENEEERPCGIYPNGVELPTNHADLL